MTTLSGKIDTLRNNDLSDMKVEIATLKLKAGVWGLMGGAIPVGIGIAVMFLRAPMT